MPSTSLLWLWSALYERVSTVFALDALFSVPVKKSEEEVRDWSCEREVAAICEYGVAVLRS